MIIARVCIVQCKIILSLVNAVFSQQTRISALTKQPYNPILNNLLHRPVAVLLTTLAALVLGLLAAGQLPISLLPEVGIPRVSVQVSYPNAAARTVEDASVSPLRNTLLQVNGLADIQFRAIDEFAVF